MLVLGTPDLAHEVLHAPGGTYLAGAANRRILPVLPENTLLTLDGDAHRERRRGLAPLFHGDSLAAIGPLIRELATREIERWPVGKSFAVLPRMRVLTLSIAARLVVGVSGDAAVARLQRCLSRALRPYSMLAGHKALRRLGPASPQAAAGRRRRSFARCLAGGLRAEQAEAALSPMNLDGQIAADEAFALLLAGHETTATALAWAIHELARVPETADVVAHEPPTGHRPWLEAVTRETLRLHPPLIDIVRQPVEPVELAGQRVPAGALLLIPPVLVHRFGSGIEPDSFKPELLLGRRPDPRTWLPFGDGDRRCLGASLAMLELREVLPLVVERFEVRPAGEGSERARLYGTALTPGEGAQVVLALRGSSETGRDAQRSILSCQATEQLRAAHYG